MLATPMTFCYMHEAIQAMHDRSGLHIAAIGSTVTQTEDEAFSEASLYE